MRLHTATIFLIGAFVAELANPMAVTAAVADNEQKVAPPTVAHSATISFRPEELDRRIRVAQQESGTVEPAGNAVGDPAVAEQLLIDRKGEKRLLEKASKPDIAKQVLDVVEGLLPTGSDRSVD